MKPGRRIAPCLRQAMRRWALLGVPLLACGLVLTSAFAALEPSWTWFGWNHATGGWNGYRQKLNKGGIEPGLEYTADFLASSVGGQEQGSSYAAGLYGSVELDFETLFGLKGTGLYAAVS